MVERMKSVRVAGKNNKHKVLLYTLSTCAWCKLTKQFLRDNAIEYEFVDMDLCSEEDKQKIRHDISRRGGRLSFPTIIIDDERLITGFNKENIAEALEI